MPVAGGYPHRGPGTPHLHVPVAGADAYRALGAVHPHASVARGRLHIAADPLHRDRTVPRGHLELCTRRQQHRDRHRYVPAPAVPVVVAAVVPAIVARVIVAQRRADGHVAAAALPDLERDILDRPTPARRPLLGAHLRRAALGRAHVHRSVEVPDRQERAGRYRAAPRVDGIAPPHQRLRAREGGEHEQECGEHGRTREQEHDTHRKWGTPTVIWQFDTHAVGMV